MHLKYLTRHPIFKLSCLNAFTIYPLSLEKKNIGPVAER